jgi:phage gpG-like protein
MQFTVNVKPSLNQIVKRRKKRLLGSVKKALSITAEKGVQIILDRTEKGIGFKGKFKPYSKQYLFEKSKKDKSGIVNLMMTGQMLGAMTTKANRRQAEIFFIGSNQNRKATFNNKTRPFMGFDKREEKRLAKVFERYLT